MKKPYLVFFILFLSNLIARPLELEVRAKSAILMNVQTGRVLYQKNPHIRLFPASTTKIATAYYVLEKIKDLDQMIIPSKESLKVVRAKDKKATHSPYVLEHDGYMLRILEANKPCLLKDLIFSVLITSANDAANVVAEAVSGSIPKFMGEMNLFIKGLGCENTHFVNPHGLHVSNHYTTAYDLALMAKHAMQNPIFQEIVSMTEYSFKHQKKDIFQSNRLLRPGAFYYPKAYGIKTGYTSKAGYSLVAAAKDERRSLLAVVLACESDNERFEDAIRLFEKAFSEEKIEKKFVEKQRLFHKKIKGAKRSLKAQLKEDLIFAFFPSEEPLAKAFIHWDHLKLPIKKGQKVAVAALYEKDQLLAEVDLIAIETLEKSFFQKMKDFIRVR